MIVDRLVAHLDAANTGLLSSSLEILRKKLALLVEIVAGTLERSGVSRYSYI